MLLIALPLIWLLVVAIVGTSCRLAARADGRSF
jgi:hypothetical protein